MLHISNLLSHHLMDHTFSRFHAARERSHHTNHVVLVFLDGLDPNLEEVPEPKTVDLKEAFLVK
jgi:hypothetical protein